MKNPPDLSQNVPQISIAGSAPLQLRRDRLSSTCRSYRRFLAAVLVAVSVCVLVIWLDVFHHIECHLSGHGLIQSPGSCSPTPLDLGHEEEINPGNKIPLEVHIMSKCPDARDCLQQLVVPAMEQVNGKVDFGLSFIAR